jgi:hypothetical protein
MAWSAKVLSICGSGKGMMPAVTDLDGLELAPPMVGGKRTFPSAFNRNMVNIYACIYYYYLTESTEMHDLTC